MSNLALRMGGAVWLVCSLLGCVQGGAPGPGCAVAGVPGQSLRGVTFDATIDGTPYTLEAMIYQPDDDSAHPLVLLSHGRNGPSPARNPQQVCGLAPLARALAARGYVVMNLVRRGYGNSDGPDSEYLETAEDSAFAGAKDVASGVEYMRTQPGVDASRVALVGHSQGGWVTLAASTLPIDGLLGAVNLSGGINFQQEHGTTIRSSPVNEMHMFHSARVFGAAARAPSAWLYAENDNFRIDSVRAWRSAFEQAGGTATLTVTPARGTGTEGHNSTVEPDVILDDVTSFFASVGLSP